MKDRKSFLQVLKEGWKAGSSGLRGALIGLALALSFLIFHLWGTLFILLAMLMGYYLGARYFNSREEIAKFLDKLFPPGTFH